MNLRVRHILSVLSLFVLLTSGMVFTAKADIAINQPSKATGKKVFPGTTTGPTLENHIVEVPLDGKGSQKKSGLGDPNDAEKKIPFLRRLRSNSAPPERTFKMDR